MLQYEPGFQGCFMRNETLPKHGSFILNLDDVSGLGTHWVAVFPDRNIYYDSYGLKWPNELDHFGLKEYNSIQHQRMNSNLCGLYCIAVIKLINKGVSFYNICYDIFKHSKHNKNDGTFKHLLYEMQK